MANYTCKDEQYKAVSYYSYVTGPEQLPLVFVEGEELGGLLLRRFPLSPDDGYYRRGRVTEELVEE
jgi:hypothetical protein